MTENANIGQMKYRNGELIIKTIDIIPIEITEKNKLDHLILARGEVTGHKHEITEGEAELYEKDGILYLFCQTECELTHQDHKTIILPKGNYEITVQREYFVGDEKYKVVGD